MLSSLGYNHIRNDLVLVTNIVGINVLKHYRFRGCPITLKMEKWWEKQLKCRIKHARACTHTNRKPPYTTILVVNMINTIKIETHCNKANSGLASFFSLLWHWRGKYYNKAL